ncbi:MAG TPA: hypothetical protein VH593_10240, partial [Ktedonobacteraceae bacterium]
MSLLDQIASAIGHTPETLAQATGTSVETLEGVIGGLGESGIDAFSAASRLSLTPDSLLRGIVTRMKGDPYQRLLSYLQAPVKPMSDPLTSLTTLWGQMADLHQNTAQAIDKHIQDLFQGSGTESYSGPAADALWNTHQGFQRYFTTLVDHAQTQQNRHSILSGHVDDYVTQMPGKVNSLPTATAALGVLGLDRALPSLGGPGQHQQMLPSQPGHQSPSSQDPWWQPIVDGASEVEQQVEENPEELLLLIPGAFTGVDEVLGIILIAVVIIIVLVVIIGGLIQKLQDHQNQQNNTKFNPPPNLTPVPAPTPGPIPGQLTPKQLRLVQSISDWLPANGINGIKQSDIENLVRLGYDRDTIIQILLAGIPTTLPKAQIDAQLADLQSRINETARPFTPREKRLAYLLSREGKKVVSVADNNRTRTGDALVNGVPTEFKSLDPGATSDSVRNTVQRSIKRGGQARNIIIDARGSGLTEE